MAAAVVWAATAAFAVAAPLAHNDPTQVLPAPPPAPTPALNLPTAPAPLARQDKSVRLTLVGVKFNGAVAVPEARLQPAWAGMQGKSVSLADLRAIGRRAEAIYAQAGYPFVAVVLTVQEVKNGIVNYDVVEGRISDLTVLGSSLAARRQATAAFQPIVNRSPLALADVKSAYQLAKLVPGLSISGTLRRGSEPGGMELSSTPSVRSRGAPMSTSTTSTPTRSGRGGSGRRRLSAQPSTATKRRGRSTPRRRSGGRCFCAPATCSASMPRARR